MTFVSDHTMPAGSDQFTTQGEPVGHRRVAVPVTAATLADRFADLVAAGYRLALVAAHDDKDALRAVYLLTAAGPDRRDPAPPMRCGVAARSRTARPARGRARPAIWRA